MLAICASGFSVEPKKHKQWVRYNGKTFRLPKGKHGQVDPEIQKGHIKRLVRRLEIDAECAKQHLDILR